MGGLHIYPIQKGRDYAKTDSKEPFSIYTAKILDAKTNIDVLMINPTSIPEHSDFTKELDKHITEIATAKEKIAVLETDLAYLGEDH